MKKSELKKYISEALTPDEASKLEPKYKETYAAMIRGKGPLKLKKYDNPDKVVRGRVINNLKESTRRTNEKLDIAIKEVFSEKQRKYMCVMAQPGAKRPKGLSKADAKEMCADTNISKAKQEEQTLEEMDAIMEKNAREQAAKMFQKMPKGKIIKTSKGDFKKIDIDKFEKVGKPGRTINSFAMSMIKETGQEIAKKNMDDYKRLNELVKAALMGPINEKKKDHDGDGDIDSDDYMIARDKAIKKAKDKKVNEIKERILRELRGDINEQDYKFQDANDERVKLLRPLIKSIALQAANAIEKMARSGKLKKINDQEGAIGNSDLSLALGVEVLAALQDKL